MARGFRKQKFYANELTIVMCPFSLNLGTVGLEIFCKQKEI